MEGTTQRLDRILHRWKSGEASARQDLIQHAGDRLRRLARRYLKRFPRVQQRGFEPDDVAQETAIRLMKTLESLERSGEFVDSGAGFLRLAACKTHQFLLSVIEKKFQEQELTATREAHLAKNTTGPGTRAALNDHVLFLSSQLPEPHLEVFRLKVILGLSIPEISEHIALSESEVYRRWATIKDLLADHLS